MVTNKIQTGFLLAVGEIEKLIQNTPFIEGLIFSAGFALLPFLFGMTTIPAVVMFTFFGMLIFAFTGFPGFVLMILYVLTDYICLKLRNEKLLGIGINEALDNRISAAHVIGGLFFPTFMAFLYVVDLLDYADLEFKMGPITFGSKYLWVALVSSFAASASYILSTEINWGPMKKRRTSFAALITGLCAASLIILTDVILKIVFNIQFYSPEDMSTTARSTFPISNILAMLAGVLIANLLAHLLGILFKADSRNPVIIFINSVLGAILTIVLPLALVTILL